MSGLCSTLIYSFCVMQNIPLPKFIDHDGQNNRQNSGIGNLLWLHDHKLYQSL